MLIIDENISEIEVWRLREWSIAVRQIGPAIAETSVTDENILPVLHRLKRPTFFTRDLDFWDRRLVHRGYCLVFLDIREREGEIAAAIRRFLRPSVQDPCRPAGQGGPHSPYRRELLAARQTFTPID